MTITLTREEAQQVLDALEYHVAQTRPITRTQETIETLRARLAQPEPEPVAWMHDQKVGFNVPLYTAPPQREWQGLTDEEIWQGNKESWVTKQAWESAVWWAEEKLKEKNA